MLDIKYAALSAKGKVMIQFFYFLLQGSKGRRRHWADHYPGPQSYIVMFPYSLAYQLYVLLLNFDWLVC